MRTEGGAKFSCISLDDVRARGLPDSNQKKKKKKKKRSDIEENCHEKKERRRALSHGSWEV